MLIAKKSLTRSGSYLLKKAVRIAEELFSSSGGEDGKVRFATKRSIMDGFLLEGKRTGSLGAATVIDAPFWIVLVGQVKVDDAPTTDYDSLILEAEQGRDSAIYGTTTIKAVEGVGRFLSASPYRDWGVGNRPDTIYIYGMSTGEYGAIIRGVGVGRNVSHVRSDKRIAENLYAFVDRSSYVIYRTYTLCPQAYRIVFSKVEDWIQSYIGVESDPRIHWSLAISDSLIRSSGALPFSLRVSPPEYKEGDTAATAYSIAQAPWHASVAILEGEESIRVIMWAHVVFLMASDSDKFGSRGIWISTFRITQEGAELIASSLKPSSGIPERTPQLDAGGLAYLYNCHIRTSGCELSSGQVVIVDPFQVERLDESGLKRRFMNVDLHVVGAEGEVSTTNVVQGVPADGQLHDFRAPIGAATDGETVVSVFFGTSFTRAVGLDIVVFNPASGVSVALSLQTDFYPCVAAESSSESTTGRQDYQIFWQALGAGGDQVCYIGEGRFLFYVSSQVVATPFFSGNWAVAIYDMSTNGVGVVGIIDPDIPTSTPRINLGKPECIRAERRDEDGEVINLATIIATRGGNSQVIGDPGAEGGDTWISYDSGATWQKIADYGSPAAAVYCGNVLQSRTEPPIRV